MISTRAEQYVEQFESVNADLISALTESSDQAWRKQTSSEGWPVAVVAHHLAEVYGTLAGTLENLTDGTGDAPAFTSKMIDKKNANHARNHTDAGQQETLDLLKVNALRALRDEQFDDTALVIDGNPLSAAQVTELALIAHVGVHLASVQTTIAS